MFEPPIPQVIAPPSKSIANRALLITSLSDGWSKLHNLPQCADVKVFITALRTIGLEIYPKKNHILIKGNTQVPACHQALSVGQAGTVARFLPALLSLGQGTYAINALSPMTTRPMHPLFNALEQSGMQIARGKTSFPIKIHTNTKHNNVKKIQIDTSQSSQFASAMMLVNPYTNYQLQLSGNLASKSYLKLTQEVMSDFGVHSYFDSQHIFHCQGTYTPRNYVIAGDASSASYFLAAAAINRSQIAISNLNLNTSQGDFGFIKILKHMGCKISYTNNTVILHGRNDLNAVTVDMNTMSDVVPSLAVLAIFAKGITKIRNVAHIRKKECNRISALCTELNKLGCKTEEHLDGLDIYGQEHQKPKHHHLKTYGDHRMAMALSLTSLKIPNIYLDDIDCCAKSFPNFFSEFKRTFPENLLLN